MSLRKNFVTIPEAIIEMLLDIYADKTDLPVALFQENNKTFIWSKKGKYSPLCSMINGGFPLVEGSPCDEDHRKRCSSAKGVPELCYAGLWNVSLPIIVDDKLVGVLISGQRRLKDKKKNDESFAVFNNFMNSHSSGNKDSLRLQFDQTPYVEQQVFDSHLLESLVNIQKSLYTWASSQAQEIKDRRNKIQQLAHEFLLPIQSIVADAENLYKELEVAELKELAQNVFQEMQKLAFIAENMRGSLLQPTKQRYHFSKHSMYKCLIKNVDLYQREAGRKGVTIYLPYTPEDDFPQIEMSFDDLNRAFSNLIQNAVKYSFSGLSVKERFIRITGEPAGNFYKVSISNYGIGILPEEILSGKIYEDGYRGELSADRHRTGSGMGLSEVKKIIELHNGKIDIVSENKGKAYKTTANIYLPYEQIDTEVKDGKNFMD